MEETKRSGSAASRQHPIVLRLMGRLLLVWLGLVLVFGGSHNVKGVDAAPEATAETTFIVVSDLHYNWPVKGQYNIQRCAIAHMNAIPGWPYPAEIGGQVGWPHGVLVLGDLTEHPGNGAAAAYGRDFSVNGEGLLRFPVYEGLGNHDAGDEDVWESMRARNYMRRGLESISSNDYHYSWTWNGVHFVMLNVFGGDTRDPQARNTLNPRHALDFLAKDLFYKIGQSGKPTIILQHYGLDAGDWWTQSQVDAFYKVIRAYNIVCIIHGHIHQAKKYRWRGIDVISDGSIKSTDPNAPASFFVFRIQGNQLTAIQRYLDGTWGQVQFQKTFSYGTDPTPPPAQPSEVNAEEFVPLFNGRNLDGWEQVGGNLPAWRVRDGVLYTNGNNEGSWLSTTKEYGDFELELEFRLPAHGNSGVFVRAPVVGNPTFTGMEIQVLDDYSPKHQGLKSSQYCGSIYEAVAPSQRASLSAGQWQHMRIRAEGDEVSVTLNGVLVIDKARPAQHQGQSELLSHPGLTRTRGYIGLQNYGTRVEYRNLNLRSLASTQ